jgi:alpha-beta hydrolase superfamily lysophospholipase
MYAIDDQRQGDAMQDTSDRRTPAALQRRDLLKASAATVGAVVACGATAAPVTAATSKIVAQEHWVMKGPVKLYVYRKHLATPASKAKRPVLFLVHGSTFSSRGSYDLMVPGRTGYSAMDHFAGLGYDVWTMDHEGYGFSARTDDNSGIRTGVADLKAAMPLVEKVTGQSSLLMFGESSGAIRAGAFAMDEPRRVDRLVLHAFTYTGTNAPEIERRRKQAETYKAKPRRPFGMAQVQNIFDRDVAGKADPVLVKALADFELKFGDSVPSGTYLDMALNMPMVDPKALSCAVCLVRPEHDGNASTAELHDFFQNLATADKQFTFVDGMTHGGGMIGSQRHRLWHIVHSFMSMPKAPVA